MQPFNYITNVQNPVNAAMEGYRFGLDTRRVRDEMQVQQQQRQLAMQQAQAEAAQQAELQQALRDLMANPNPTWQDYERVAVLAPKDQQQFLLNSWKQRGEDGQASDLRFAGQVMAALNTDPGIATNMLRERAAATRNGGDDQMADAWDAWAQMAEIDPDSVARAVGVTVAGLPGGKDILAALGRREGFRVLSQQEISERGLPPGAVYQLNTENGKIEVLSGAGQRFEILSGSDARALGLPPNQAYQRDMTTGKISGIGAGGVTVNLPRQVQIGSIPQDYRLIFDEDGNPTHMEVIPGSKTERQLRAEEGAAAARAEGDASKSTIVLEEISRMRNAVREQNLADPITGIPGEIAARIPGSLRRSVEGMERTIRANVGFEALNQMRRESPTGGALGQITERELGFLQATLGEIGLSQNREELIHNLDRLERIYSDILRKAQAYPNASQFGFGGGNPQSNTGPRVSNTVTVNGQTFTRPANFTDQQWSEYRRAVGAD